MWGRLKRQREPPLPDEACNGKNNNNYHEMWDTKVLGRVYEAAPPMNSLLVNLWVYIATHALKYPDPHLCSVCRHVLIPLIWW